MTFWDPIEQEWQRMLRRVPMPVNPHQPMVSTLAVDHREISDDRSDFTREAEATSV